MGQYLTIGLLTRIAVGKERAKKTASATPEEVKYVWVSTPFCREIITYRLDTSATQIILSLDGKILMECYEGLFEFFTRMIRERLSKYRLSDALSVSISG